MIFRSKFDVGQIVYLKTDVEQLRRQVITITVYPGGFLLYCVACGIETSEHYDVELSEEEDIALKTSN